MLGFRLPSVLVTFCYNLGRKVLELQRPFSAHTNSRLLSTELFMELYWNNNPLNAIHQPIDRTENGSE